MLPPKDGEPTAAALVGLLAEEDRLRAVAALALGARTLDEVAVAAGLDLRRTSSALERLVAGGLVGRGADGSGLRLLAERFKHAAQVEAMRAAAARPEESFEGVAPEKATILRNFITEGRLRQIPVSRAKRVVILDWLAGRFDPGKIYPEHDVNLVLASVHADVAALRRYLVDEEFLERRDGFYWRAGGTFEVD